MIKKEDVEQYYRLYGQLGVKEGNSKEPEKFISLLRKVC